ncbi:MAG TPA: erythromycin esterase family protein [Chitinophagaceae bacterium]|nr:erythromycin esterase family protein [Chitinophagaceae bacterium]
MHKQFFLLLTLCWINSVTGQVYIKKYVKNNIIPIKSVDPDSTNYSDLEAIGIAIGNSKIVMLGEQDHGDAPAFLAKTRLIKYLHEKKGFNVIAFESDFFGLNFGWDNLTKTPASVRGYLHQNIFPIWAGCNACWPLLENYIPNSYLTPSPLSVTGFDNQMILEYSSKFLISKLDSVLRSLDLPITKQENYRIEILPLIDSLSLRYRIPPKDTTLYTKCGQYLTTIKKQADQKLNKSDYWWVIIENLLQENIEYQASKTNWRLSMNTRDRQMAVNLKWLAENKFPNDKIIVWAANYHIAKYGDSTNKDKTLISMGNYFTRDSSLMNSTYIIGFTSYDGEAGRLGRKDFSINKPRRNGFETWINESYDYAFIDFKRYTKLFPGKTEKFYLKGLFHISFITEWPKIFDGVFYIKKMYPCRKY